MTRLVECVPNFSEGRDAGVIAALAETAKSVPGVVLLDYSSDINHNRSVFTLIGDGDGVAEAAFRLCKTACANIDMTKHRGEHPRMGATDVIPFVPIGAGKSCGNRGDDSAKGGGENPVADGAKRDGAACLSGCGNRDDDGAMAGCVELSRIVAKRIFEELGIPCFLYEESCSRESRRNLADVRRGEFEGMPAKLLLDGWAPDFGGRRIHPTAGVTAVGARRPLIAFNVSLGTPDVRIAARIAKKIRGSSGGFKYCKAIGIRLADKNMVQVSMNMVNYEETPLYEAFEAIRGEAERLGVPVTGGEIVGMAPSKALIDCARYYLKIDNFDSDRQVLENRLIAEGIYVAD